MIPWLLLAACTPDDADTAADSPAGMPDDTSDTGSVRPPLDAAAPCPDGPDADGDGWTTQAGDCDDCDAITHPGAPELCDGFDQDCDGVAILPGGCAEGIDVSDYEALPGWAGTLDNAYVGAGVATGGEGQEDLLYSSFAWYPLAEGLYVYAAIALFDAMPAGAALPWPQGAALLTWPSEGYSWWDLETPLADHDGDGVREVMLYAPGEWEGGAVFLIDVPTGDPVVGDYEEVSRAVWRGPPEDPGFAASMDASVDLDGDGLSELAIVTPTRWVDRAEAPSRLYLARGRPGLDGELDPLDEVFLDGRDDGVEGIDWTEYISTLYGLPDLDGDGGDELLLYTGIYGMAVGSGRTLLASDGAHLGDVFQEVSRPDDHTYPAAGYLSPGDWDGDGIGDLVWGRMGETDDDDCIYVVSYPAPFGGDVLTDTLQQLCMHDAHADGYIRATHDVDGDGLLDPTFKWVGNLPGPDEGNTNTQFLVPTTWLDGGRADVVDVGIRIGFEADTDPELLVLADLDDDGTPEFVETTREGPDTTIGDEGCIRVLQGFPLPFDDPTMW